MILFFILLAGTSAANLPGKRYYDPNDAPSLFKEFVQKHGKVYNPEEYLKRFQIFKETLKEINELNAKDSLSEFGLNHFADFTEEERESYCDFKPIDDSVLEMAEKYEVSAEEMTAPDAFDWRDHHAVTRVKFQNNCGCGWIFSAVGNIEGQYAIKYNKTVAFSEQQNLDCVQPIEADNCQGGWPHMVMFHNARGIGVIPEKNYKPYADRPTACREKAKHVLTHVTSFKIYLPSEDALKQLLYEKGPLSVAIHSRALGFYHGGIMTAHQCHEDLACAKAVLLVGYGEEKGVKYWILKNSCGLHWGEKGYFRLIRGENACRMGTSYTATCTVS